MLLQSPYILDSETKYIPKSQRPWEPYIKRVRKYFSWHLDRIDTLTDKWDTSTLDKRRVRSSLQMARDFERSDPHPTLPQRSKWRKLAQSLAIAIALSQDPIIEHDTLWCQPVVAMSATGAYGDPVYKNTAPFDTDSNKIGIDNRASACISLEIRDFIRPLQDCRKIIAGVGGTRLTDVKKGTIQWTWTDDQGRPHKFLIHDSYFVPSANVRLLSPQHWARCIPGQREGGTGCTTIQTTTMLFWNDHKYIKTIKHGKNDNVASMYLAPGYDRFTAFCQNAEVQYDETIRSPIEDTQAPTDDDEDDEPIAAYPLRDYRIQQKLAGLYQY